MNKTANTAIVTGRLLLAGLLVIIRWAVFMPLYFIGLIVYTIGESGINAVTNYTSWAKIENDKILTPTNTTKQ